MICPCCEEKTATVSAYAGGYCVACYETRLLRSLIWEYRIDLFGLVFRVIEGEKAAYCYGQRALPKLSLPITDGAERWAKQSASMWVCVGLYAEYIEGSVFRLAKKYGVDLEAAHDVGMDAAMRAGAWMKPNLTVKGEKGFLHRCITNAILDLARNDQSTARKLPIEPLTEALLGSVAAKDSQSPYELGGSREAAGVVTVRAAAERRLGKLWEELDDRERYILDRIALQGKTLEEVGESLGVTKQAIHSTVTNIRYKCQAVESRATLARIRNTQRANRQLRRAAVSKLYGLRLKKVAVQP